MSKPRIVVALTTFNGQQHLEEQLDSISRQVLAPDAVYVSDDSSTDGTWGLLQGWASRQTFPVHLHRNQCNMGVVANMEALLLRATGGDVVVLCDQDDRWDDQKLTAVAEAFDRRPAALWLSDGHLMDELGHLYPSQTLWSGVHLSTENLLTKEGQLHERGLRRLVLGMTVTGAAMAVRSDVVKAALPFPSVMHGAHPPFLHDGWLALFAALSGDVVMEPRQLLIYRQHQSQYTAMSLVADGSTGVRPAEPTDRETVIMAELSRLDLVLEAVDGRDPRTFSARRIAFLRRLRRFLAVRQQPTTSAILVRAAKGDYSLFANGIRTCGLDLLRTRTRRSTHL
ncbi:MULTISPECIES: glycosyltransferase [unclassified Ornithinimicrobium]|uniref:glycosyltransferase n=1 Tax=unclassified Ornithinimicrobium TaxID=2615080 RepID=UPI003854EE6C